MTEESAQVRQSYEMVSVRPTERPTGTEGTEGSDWHRYVIAFGGTECIQGCRQGNLKVVTGAVQEIVNQLNERHSGKHGRVHLVPTPKKPAPSKT